ncbi:MAG: ATP-binding protein [Elusimicrobia bacterium]|nr:ATP-binding protein [Elusimicrobiota bacterium]
MKIIRSVFAELAREISRPEVSILLGPRQVGKTFLLCELQKNARKKNLRTRYYDLELPSDLMAFNKTDAEIFRMLTQNVDVVFIDEFHYLKNASRIFKAIFDSHKKIKIFVSGSSSIEIHKHIKESLAGRRLTTRIAPLSFDEFSQKARKGEAANLFEEYAVYGGLPGLIHAPDASSKIRILNELLAAYIQKDVKGLVKEENIRAFNNLIYLLAENQGSLISENSLAGEIGLTAATVNRHLSILDNTYVCHAVHSYSRDLGNELKKSKKIYFYDLGIRNALLKDFGTLSRRSDKGAIHESFVFLQLVCALKPNMEIKFWRNKSGQEIDFVLLKDRRPFLIEVKSSLPGREILPAMKIFLANYPETAGAIVFSENQAGTEEFLGKTVRFEPLSSAYNAIQTIMSSK